MPANIEMKKQGNLYVPSEISDYCNGVVPYQRDIDRRDFLKMAGLASSAGILASCQSASEPEPEEQPVNKKEKL